MLIGQNKNKNTRLTTPTTLTIYTKEHIYDLYFLSFFVKKNTKTGKRFELPSIFKNWLIEQ